MVGGRGGKFDGAKVVRLGIFDPAQADEKIGAHSMEGLITIKHPGKRLNLRQCGGGVAAFGQSNGMVQRDDGCRLEILQAGVEGGDLRPVRGGILGMKCGNRGLDLERAGGTAGDGGVKKVAAFVKFGAVPKFAVLLARWQGKAVRASSGGLSALGQQKKRQCRFDFGLLGREVDEEAQRKIASAQRSAPTCGPLV